MLASSENKKTVRRHMGSTEQKFVTSPSTETFLQNEQFRR